MPQEGLSVDRRHSLYAVTELENKYRSQAETGKELREVAQQSPSRVTLRRAAFVVERKVFVLKKLIVGVTASFLALAAYATGPVNSGCNQLFICEAGENLPMSRLLKRKGR